MFVTGEGDLFKFCTPIPMDFAKRKVLMFIRSPGFIELLLACLEGKSSPSAVEIQTLCFLAPFQQLALCSTADLLLPPVLYLVHVHHMILLACFSCCVSC